MPVGIKPQRSTFERNTARTILFDRYFGPLLGFEDEYEMDCFIIDNETRFMQDVNEWPNDYKKTKQAKVGVIRDPVDWTLPSYHTYGTKTHDLVVCSNYAYQECWLKIDRSKPEKYFEARLVANQNVEWWYKNKDRGEFSRAYSDNGKNREFNPDYIVKYNDGKIGIYETKDLSITEMKAKAEALQAYIRGEENMAGGIVAVMNHNNFYIHSKPIFNFTGSVLGNSDWEPLID